MISRLTLRLPLPSALAAIAVLCRDPGGRLRPGAAGPVVHRRGQAVLCRGGPEGGPGGRQRLCGAHRHDPEPAVRGPVLPPLLRRPGDARAERAAAALARFRRAGRPGRAGRHQPSRDRRRRPGEGLAGRPARVRGRDRPQGRPLRSRGAADQGQRRALPGARIRRFRRAPGRRPGAGDRQSLRRRPDRDARHHFGAGAHPGRHHRLSVLHPDRRRHQSRQFRRRAGRHVRQDRRHQHRDLFTRWRVHRHRLRHSGQHGARRGRLGARRRQRGQAALARRAAAGGDVRDRRKHRPETAGRRAGDAGDAKAARPRARACAPAI